MTKEYITTDTAIAAWLQTRGIRLEKIDNDGFPSHFIFSDPEWKASEIAEEFYLGKAHGNVFQFFRLYRQLVSKIKNTKDS